MPNENHSSCAPVWKPGMLQSHLDTRLAEVSLLKDQLSLQGYPLWLFGHPLTMYPFPAELPPFHGESEAPHSPLSRSTATAAELSLLSLVSEGSTSGNAELGSTLESDSGACGETWESSASD